MAMVHHSSSIPWADITLVLHRLSYFPGTVCLITCSWDPQNHPVTRPATSDQDVPVTSAVLSTLAMMSPHPSGDIGYIGWRFPQCICGPPNHGWRDLSILNHPFMGMFPPFMGVSPHVACVCLCIACPLPMHSVLLEVPYVARPIRPVYLQWNGWVIGLWNPASCLAGGFTNIVFLLITN